jgi:hypothetical protein
LILKLGVWSLNTFEFLLMATDFVFTRGDGSIKEDVVSCISLHFALLANDFGNGSIKEDVVLAANPLSSKK